MFIIFQLFNRKEEILHGNFIYDIGFAEIEMLSIKNGEFSFYLETENPSACQIEIFNMEIYVKGKEGINFERKLNAVHKLLKKKTKGKKERKKSEGLEIKKNLLSSSFYSSVSWEEKEEYLSQELNKLPEKRTLIASFDLLTSLAISQQLVILTFISN